MNLIFLLLSSTLSFGAIMTTNENAEYRDYDFNALDKMKIVNTVGKTTITPMPVNRVTITVEKKKFSEKCQININREDVTQITAEIITPAGETCDADINIQAPTDVALDMSTASGDVDIKGMKGDLKLATGTGKVHAEGAFKNLDITSASGDIAMEGLTAGGKITSGSGKIDLKYAQAPKTELTVKTASGDADVKLPKDAKINADLDSRGMTDNSFTSYSNGAPISVKSATGDLEVHSY